MTLLKQEARVTAIEDITKTLLDYLAPEFREGNWSRERCQTLLNIVNLEVDALGSRSPIFRAIESIAVTAIIKSQSEVDIAALGELRASLLERKNWDADDK